MHPPNCSFFGSSLIALLLVLTPWFGVGCYNRQAPDSPTPDVDAERPSPRTDRFQDLPSAEIDDPTVDSASIDHTMDGSESDAGLDHGNNSLIRDIVVTADQPQFDISAETLSQLFVADEVEAEKEYAGKTIRLSGTVVSEPILRNDVLVLWGGLRDSGIGVPLDALVSISFDDPSELKQLIVGQSIVCTAECSSGSANSVNLIGGKLISAGPKMIDLERFALTTTGRSLSIVAPKDSRVIQRGDQVRVFGLGIDLAIRKQSSDRFSRIKEDSGKKILMERPGELLYALNLGGRTVYRCFANVKLGEDMYEVTNFGLGTAHRAVAERSLAAAKSLNTAAND